MLMALIKQEIERKKHSSNSDGFIHKSKQQEPCIKPRKRKETSSVPPNLDSLLKN